MSDSPGHDGIDSHSGGPSAQPIPRGIEVLVKKASVDPAFRQALLEKRAAAAAEIGLELSATEATMLNSVPQSQIEQIVQNTTVPDEHRRVFLGKAAAAMVAVLGLAGFGLTTCVSVTGCRSDWRYDYVPTDPGKSAPEKRSTSSDGRDDSLKDKGSDKGSGK
jgi:hypothetical protein